MKRSPDDNMNLQKVDESSSPRLKGLSICPESSPDSVVL
jgi:hypothetical protein